MLETEFGISSFCRFSSGGQWMVVSLLAELCLILSCGFAAVLTTTQFIAVEIEANQHFRRSLLNLQNFLFCIFLWL